MALSCECGFDYDYEWYYEVEEIEQIASETSKCYGCCGTINTGDEIRIMTQYQMDDNGWEENNKALGKLCPVCSGLYDSLIGLGFCLSADWNFITEAMDEYRNEEFV